MITAVFVFSYCLERVWGIGCALFHVFFILLLNLSFEIRCEEYLRELDDICIGILFLYSRICFDRSRWLRKKKDDGWLLWMGTKLTRNILAVLSYFLN